MLADGHLAAVGPLLARVMLVELLIGTAMLGPEPAADLIRHSEQLTAESLVEAVYQQTP